jgi:aerobic carbon-monoxide dehydrogenase medium subunit
MKFPPFAYRRPESLDEACEMLAADGARPLAGGQSLLPLMALRLARPTALVDLTNLRELSGIDADQAGDELGVGAVTTHSQLEASTDVRTGIPVLVPLARLIGHPAIRHRGTVGGSIAHADPAAELPAACIALGADVEIASFEGKRRERVESLIVGPYQTRLKEHEFISRVWFPVDAQRRAGAAEVALRGGDFALAGAICVLDGEGTGASATMTFFGVEAKPRKLALDGDRVPGDSSELYWQSLASRLDEAVEDSHADARFRTHLAAVAARRAFESASLDQAMAVAR